MTSAGTSMRLLFCSARYYPMMGGIETHTYEVARRLARLGVDVSVLTTDPTGRLPAQERQEGVQIIRERAYPAGRDYYYAPGVFSRIAQGGWDLVHCQGIHTFAQPLAMLGCLRAGLPYVVTFHAGAHSSRLRSALRGVQYAALAPLVRRASRYVGVSEYEVDLFVSRMGLEREKCIVIPNGSDLPAVEPCMPDPAAPLVVSVGRLERYKGHHRLIAAMPFVRLTLPTARLLILGDGPYAPALRQMAADLGVNDCVTFRSIPPSERQEMARALASASLVALLSEGESHPVAVMEALSLGRPALVADTTGLSELASRGLVRAIPLDSTPIQVAEAVVANLQQPLQPPVFRLPTWDGCARDLLAVYGDVLGREAGLCVS